MNKVQFLMGNQAIALAAMEAGVNIATGYPGTPSSEVLETIAQNADKYDIYVEWSTNEKVALETAIGAAYAGAKAITTMKQVGLNVASDPLMSLSYIGVKGALVIMVADDPGPHSSQTEQDTRSFARFANIPVLDPATPQEAHDMTLWAFNLSNQLQTPVIMRTTTRVSHGCADVTIGDISKASWDIEGFTKDPRWAIFPKLTAQRHPWLENLQGELANIFSASPFNCISGNGKIGIISSGISRKYVQEALGHLGLNVKLLEIGTPYPFPEAKALEFAKGLDHIIAVEELDSYLEEQTLQLVGRFKLPARVLGKIDGMFPKCGEYNVDVVEDGLQKCLKYIGAESGIKTPVPIVEAQNIPPLPNRQPTLCAGCMHRTVFYAFKRALNGIPAVFSGDIGCYTLGNAQPLDMVDTCLCMGAGISIAAGLQHAQPNVKHIAFIGDSTFFHSGIPAIINAVYNNANIIIAVLDNRTTAMTGHQPHPGIGITATGKPTAAVSIAEIARSCGVKTAEEIDGQNLKACTDAIKRVVEVDGPSVLIFKGPCTNLEKSDKHYTIDEQICTLCNYCVEQLGCPALFVIDDMPAIQSTCAGCGLCAQICPVGAIVPGGED